MFVLKQTLHHCSSLMDTKRGRGTTFKNQKLNNKTTSKILIYLIISNLWLKLLTFLQGTMKTNDQEMTSFVEANFYVPFNLYS